MARMHSSARGKASSKRPLRTTKQSWITIGEKEIELLICKLAKEGKTKSQIGLILRDVYGIPDVRLIVKKKIGKVLEEKKLHAKLPEDLLALVKKSVILRKHIEENRKDQPARRGLLLTDSKIRRLAKYYQRQGKVAENWKFDAESLKLYAE